jgi:putative ABC transport system permease protein
MFNRDRQERDLDDELRAFVELVTAEKIKQGMAPDAARRAALLETGGVEQVKEEVRDVEPGVLLNAFIQDARYAARSLRKAPVFTLAAVITLTIGIGASTAIFSMVNGVLLHRLPIGSGDRLVHLTAPSARATDEGYSMLEVADLNRDLSTMSGVAEFHSMAFQLYGHGDPLRVQTGVVSDRFFDMIGVRPILGRTFRPGEDVVGAPPVVVLSYRFWMDQFHGDSSIIGASFTMNDRVQHVVGVLPPLPGYPNENDIWMPAGACPFRSAPMMLNDRGMRMVSAYAVLKPGTSLEQAQTELAAVNARYRAAFPSIYPAQDRLRFVATPAREEMTARAKPILLMLLATAAFLLLAAVANVANLSLSRQMRRARELALRVALGAGSGRLYRQLTLEALLLTLCGGVGGVLLAASGVGLLRSVATRFTPRAGEIQMSVTVLAFATVLCIVIALMVAAAPFVHQLGQRNVATALRQGNTGTMGTRGDLRMRSLLVVAQVAIAFVMVVGAGLIARSLVALERVDAGIDVSNVLTARLTLSFSKYNTTQLRRAFAAEVIQRLAALPNVTSFAVASTLPLAGDAQLNDQPFQIDGSPTPPGARGPASAMTAVSPNYFRTVGIPLLHGRDLVAADRDTSNPVAVVSQRLAKTYWGGRDPVGTRITSDSGRHWVTIVGVVGDVRQSRLDGEVTNEIYFPVALAGDNDLRLFLRTTGALPPVVRALRAAIADVDNQQPLSSVQTLEQVRGAQLAEPRLTTTLLSAFAILALVLTATGLAGVIGYGVTQRLPEIAIRMALGADGSKVVGLVMRDGLMIVLVGLAAGFGMAFVAARLMRQLLFSVTPSDASTYATAIAVILGTAVVACLVPSRRALRTDPAGVFRAG